MLLRARGGEKYARKSTLRRDRAIVDVDCFDDHVQSRAHAPTFTRDRSDATPRTRRHQCGPFLTDTRR